MMARERYVIFEGLRNALGSFMTFLMCVSACTFASRIVLNRTTYMMHCVYVDSTAVPETSLAFYICATTKR